MTRIEALNNASKIISAVYENNDEIIEELADSAPEVIEVLEGMAEKLKARSTSPRKPTKKQLENENIMTDIYTLLMQEDRPLTVKEISEKVPALVGKKEKTSALLTILRKQKGMVKRTYEKKVAYFECGQDEEYLKERSEATETTDEGDD